MQKKNKVEVSHFPYVALVQSPGFAFYVVPYMEGGEAVLSAMKSLKPLIMLMFLFVRYSLCNFLCLSDSVANISCFELIIDHKRKYMSIVTQKNKIKNFRRYLSLHIF